MGTLAFMSPEQLGGDVPSLDARTDIYALGVVLYWLVAGELPYVGESETQLRTAILQAERRSLKDCGAVVPGELEHVCCRALAREPAARFSTAREFADALRAVERPRWRRRAFGVLGLVLLLGLLAYFWKIGRAERPSAIEPSVQNGVGNGEPREKELTPEEVVKKLQEYADTHPPRPFQPDTTDVQKALNENLGRLDSQTKAMVDDAREKIKGISPQAAKQLRKVPIPQFSFPRQPSTDPPKGKQNDGT
jgi:serine/threonine protein kinase